MWFLHYISCFSFAKTRQILDSLLQLQNFFPSFSVHANDYKNIFSSKLNAVLVFTAGSTVASSAVGTLMLLFPVSILRLGLVVKNTRARQVCLCWRAVIAVTQVVHFTAGWRVETQVFRWCARSWTRLQLLISNFGRFRTWSWIWSTRDWTFTRLLMLSARRRSQESYFLSTRRRRWICTEAFHRV